MQSLLAELNTQRQPIPTGAGARVLQASVDLLSDALS
jgi:hypothetical protein